MKRGSPAAARERLAAAVRWIRSPDLGVIGQGMRFALAGVTTAVVSLVTTITLAEGVGLAFEAAFAIGYAVAVTTHFTLQRVFVWMHREAFALPIHLQLVRYVPIALGNYGVVAVAIAVLPHLPWRGGAVRLPRRHARRDDGQLSAVSNARISR